MAKGKYIHYRRKVTRLNKPLGQMRDFFLCRILLRFKRVILFFKEHDSPYRKTLHIAKNRFGQTPTDPFGRATLAKRHMAGWFLSELW